jgi:hypothetical protein
MRPRVDASRLERGGRHVRVHDERDRIALDLTLTSNGGFHWTSRPTHTVAQQH